MTSLPAPADAARLAASCTVTRAGPPSGTSDYGVWRAAEDDPDSALYAESPDLDTVISYITAHS